MRAFLSICALGVLLLSGCDSKKPLPPPGPAMEKSGGAQDFKTRQMAFLNKIRAADPRQNTIERALLNEQNELGIILSRTAEMDKIPALLRSLLTQMAVEFPGQDLSVIAYAPSSPPKKIGTAHLDARTRDMTYQAEK